MAQRETLDKIRDLRQMRLGQELAEYTTIPSMPEVEIALVPLTEAEIFDSMKAVSRNEYPESMVGLEVADRLYNQEVLMRAIREKGDLKSRVFHTLDELTGSLNATDVNILIDKLGELSLESAGLENLSEEEFEELKKVLEKTSMSELSIKQQYALKRSHSILQVLLQDSGVGSG